MVDLDTLSTESRASHIFNVQVDAFSFLAFYDMLVALGGDRLAWTRGSAGDPATALEAAASPPPDQPLSLVDSSTQDPEAPPRKRRHDLPPRLRHSSKHPRA